MTALRTRADEPSFDFFACAGAPLAVLGEDGTLAHANDALQRLLPPGTGIGQPLASLVGAADRTRVAATIDSLPHGGSATFDASLTLAEDGMRSFRFHTTRADDGRVYVVLVGSPLGRAEDAQRLALFDRVLASAPVACFLADKNGVYTAHEGKLGEMLGLPPEAMIGRNALDMWKDSEVFPYALRALSGEEFSARMSIGKDMHIETWFMPVHDADGRFDGSLGFVIDATAQQRAERDLREKLSIIEKQNATLQMFSRVLDTAPLILWGVDPEGAYTMSEGRGLELLGFRSGEAVGLNALEMYKDHPEIARALTLALGGEESRVLTTPAPGVHFENWYMPLRGRTGEVYGAMGLGIDATERVKSEQEVREKLELIQRQSATIRALATPIIQVWDEVLCLPVIGTVDSARTADMMQGLLEAIVREQARYAIVDLTGVEVVDTSTADHLIQLFRAAKVLGVDGILCGIRPAVAQTVVALGLELGSVRTMRSLRDALKWCIRARGAARPANDARGLASLSGNGNGGGR